MWNTMGMWSGFHYFRLQVLWAAPRYKSVWRKWSLTFLLSKLSHLLLRKCCIQLLYLIFSVLYKLYHTVFTAAHFRWIKNKSITKGAVYTLSRPCMCVYVVCVWCLAFSLSLHFIFIFSLSCSSAGFKMHSNSGYRINGALNRYRLSWNFNHLFFSQSILTLAWPLMLHHS